MSNNINDTLAQRGSKYGAFDLNASVTQSLLKIVQNAPQYNKLTDQHREVLHMIFHKIARCVCGDPNYADNFHDIAGYAKLLEDFLNEVDDDL